MCAHRTQNHEPGTLNPEPAQAQKKRPPPSWAVAVANIQVPTVRVYPQRASGLTRPVMLVKTNPRPETACMGVTVLESRDSGQIAT